MAGEHSTQANLQASHFAVAAISLYIVFFDVLVINNYILSGIRYD